MGCSQIDESAIDELTFDDLTWRRSALHLSPLVGEAISKIFFPSMSKAFYLSSFQNKIMSIILAQNTSSAWTEIAEVK